MIIADSHAAEIAKSAAAGQVVLVLGPPALTAAAYEAVLERLAPERFIRASRVAGFQRLDLASGGRVLFRVPGVASRGITADLVYIWPGWATPSAALDSALASVLATGARLLEVPDAEGATP